jgi:type II secretory pathway component GspD/PulD (secretin)
VGGPDFDLLINALASQNRVQLLSNPSVMVANNTEGRIQVGESISVPQAVTVSAAGQQSAVRSEEVGVILSVTPSINPDGFVKMAVEPWEFKPGLVLCYVAAPDGVSIELMQAGAPLP